MAEEIQEIQPKNTIFNKFVKKVRFYSKVTYAIIVFFLKCLSYVLKAIWKTIKGPELKSLEGEVALVTGGGAGLGRLIALELAKNKCSVVIWDLDQNGIDKTLEEIHRIHSQISNETLTDLTALGYICDVTNSDTVYSMAEKTREDLGRDVTILINNAGVASGHGEFLDTPDHLIKRVFEVNSMAMCWTVKAMLPAMLRNRKGHIVTVASMAGYVGINRLVDYCASKHAAVGFDLALRVELESKGPDFRDIRTTCVSPYFLRATGMFSKVDSIIPQLESAYVAQQTVNAIRLNSKELLLPNYLWPVLTLRWIVPWKCVSLFLRELVPDASPRQIQNPPENIPKFKSNPTQSATDVALRLRHSTTEIVDHRQP